MLGWDITAFGKGDFDTIGLLLFTLRNGITSNGRHTKEYAEKLLFVEDGQVTPFHFHRNEIEDIINRGGGKLMVQFYNSSDNGEFADTPVTVSIDGRKYCLNAGIAIALNPGKRIPLPMGIYHKFWGDKGTGRVLAGEISIVNDGQADIRFHEAVEKLPATEEDAEPLYLLCNEYPKARSKYQ